MRLMREFCEEHDVPFPMTAVSEFTRELNAAHESWVRAQRRVAELLAAPEWNHSLDGYEPQEGDWVLVRWSDSEDSGPTLTERAIVLAAGVDAVVLGAVDAPGTMKMLLSELREQMGVAYCRPPGPPPVPEEMLRRERVAAPTEGGE